MDYFDQNNKYELIIYSKIFLVFNTIKVLVVIKYFFASLYLFLKV